MDNQVAGNLNIEPAIPSQTGQEMPRKKRSYLSILILTIIVLGLMGASVFAGILMERNRTVDKKLASNEPVEDTSSKKIVSVTPTPTVDPTASWKNYADSKARFNFKYPNDIFIYQSPPQGVSQTWYTKEGVGSPMELQGYDLWLDYSATELPDDAGLKYWSDKLNNDQPGVDTSVPSQVLKVLTTDGIKGVVYHNLPKGNSDGGYSYTAMWLKDKTIYRIELGSLDDSNLIKYQNTFYQIVATVSLVTKGLD